MRARIVTLPLLLVQTLAAGCVSIYPASVSARPAAAVAHRPESPAADTQTPQPNAESGQAAPKPAAASRWPARWGRSGAPHGVIIPETRPLDRLRTAHLGGFHFHRVGTEEYRHAEALGEAVGSGDGFRFEPEGPGSFLFHPDPFEEEPGDEPADRDKPFETVIYVSANPIDPVPGDDQERIALQRTWIANYDALPKDRDADPADSARGTIVFLPGMFGTPEPIIEGMMRYWRRAGYAVVRLMSHPSRFTEQIEAPVEPGHEREAGARLAPVFDDRMAECAYACDAGLTRMFQQRPALADKPVVLVGMSGGAIVLPTVAAYAPERYDAAVMIAGGVDFLTISAESNYAEWIDALRFDWDPEDPDSDGKPTPEAIELLSAGYLGASRLDSFHTAPELAVPSLLLHASSDRAVPASSGDKLWERLGRPERWVFPVGHELIFVMLPTQADRLQGWIDARVDEAADTGDGDQPAP